MGAATDKAFEVPNAGLILNETAGIYAGSSTPEVDAPDAPVGSQHLRSNGLISVKIQSTGSGVATDWVTIDPAAVEGGTAAQLSWRFSTTTTAANPGSKRLRYDDSTPASVTQLFINDTTNGNFDASTLLGIVTAGDRIYIQETGIAANFLLCTVVSTTDEGGWWTIDVTIDSAGGLPGNNRDLGVFIIYGGTGGGGVAGDQAAVQARRTTAQSFTTAWVDVPFDATDFENDAAVVEHDNTNTDRITLKDAGPYLILSRVTALPPANAGTNWQTLVESRVRINDTGAELPGSLVSAETLEDGSLVGDAQASAILTSSFIYDATANDFLSLQIQRTDSDIGTNIEAAPGQSMLVAIRLTGQKGDTGPAGPGGGPTEACKVRHSTTQSIPNSTETTVAFNTELYDTDGMHDTVTNNSRITPQTAGKYEFKANIIFDANAGGDLRRASIRKNGTIIIAVSSHRDVSGSGDDAVVVSVDEDMNGTTDYVEVLAFHDEGAPLDLVNAPDSRFPTFSAHRLS